MITGGITIHSWAGIRLARTKEDFDTAWSRKDNWRETDVLIIDEISMLSGQILDELNRLAKDIRGSDSPFGGIQLILCGDFLQLPPVSKRGEKASFMFESEAWTECIDEV